MLALSTRRHGIFAAAEYLPIWMRSRERLQRRNALLTYLIGGPKMKLLCRRGNVVWVVWESLLPHQWSVRLGVVVHEELVWVWAQRNCHYIL
jgi:hypothetical protein